MDENEWNAVDRYTYDLKQMIYGLIDKAMLRLQPVYLSTQNGIVRFQVNRRNNKENSINALSELNGPMIIRCL